MRALSENKTIKLMSVIMAMLITATLAYFTIFNANDAFIATLSLNKSFTGGVAVTITIFSLVLYFSKRSENYLFWLALFCYTTFIRTMDGFFERNGFNLLLSLIFLGDWPIFGPNAVELNKSFSLIILRIIVEYMRYRTIKCCFDTKILKCDYYVFIFASLVFMLPFMGNEICFSVTKFIYHIIAYLSEGYVILRAWPKQKRECLILGFAWFATVFARFLTSEAELLALLDIEPKVANAFMGVKGLSETFYGMAFFLFACLQFGDKCREADRLNSYLEAEIAKKVTNKTELLRSILHNLKTPIFSIGGYIDMAREDPEHAERYLNKASQNLEYSQQILERVFMMSQLDENKVIFQAVPFDLCDVLQNISENTKLRIGERDIKLTLSLPEKMPCIADPIHSQQAIQNIADNAVDQLEKNGNIYISATDGGESWMISIKDDGIGIDKSEQKIIFQRYYSNHHGKRPSSGLGLSITRELIERQGGSIKLISELGKGAEFIVELPKQCEKA